MKKLRHLIIFLLVLGTFAGLGFWLPRHFNVSRIFSNDSQNKTSDIEIQTDTLPYLQKLTQEIPVLQIHPAKRNRKEIWMLGKGISLPNYLLRAQKHLTAHHGEILKMEEIFPRNGASAAALDFRTPAGDTLQIELHISDSFLDSASKISILFQVDSLSIPLLSMLSNLDYPYALLVTPFDSTKSLFYDIDRLQNKEVVIWLPMESNSLQANRFSKKTVSIHHTEQEIKETIEQAYLRMPGAIGVASRMGERAVEHINLLNAVFKSLSARRLWFMDLTQSRYSKVEETCKNYPIRCFRVSPYTPQTTLEVYVDNRLWTAARTGNAVIVLPLNDKSFNALTNIKTKASARGTEIVKLSTIIATSE